MTLRCTATRNRFFAHTMQSSHALHPHRLSMSSPRRRHSPRAYRRRASPSRRRSPRSLYVVNPLTDRKVRVGGATYRELVEDGVIAPVALAAPRRVRRSDLAPLLPSAYNADARRRTSGRGCSNARRYSSDDAPFCGPAGGACDNTFPVNTRARTSQALQRARNAPNPAGVRTCARIQQIRQGWLPRASRTADDDVARLEAALAAIDSGAATTYDAPPAAAVRRYYDDGSAPRSVVDWLLGG